MKIFLLLLLTFSYPVFSFWETGKFIEEKKVFQKGQIRGVVVVENEKDGKKQLNVGLIDNREGGEEIDQIKIEFTREFDSPAGGSNKPENKKFILEFYRNNPANAEPPVKFDREFKVQLNEETGENIFGAFKWKRFYMAVYVFEKIPNIFEDPLQFYREGVTRIKFGEVSGLNKERVIFREKIKVIDKPESGECLNRDCRQPEENFILPPLVFPGEAFRAGISKDLFDQTTFGIFDDVEGEKTIPVKTENENGSSSETQPTLIWNPLNPEKIRCLNCRNSKPGDEFRVQLFDIFNRLRFDFPVQTTKIVSKQESACPQPGNFTFPKYVFSGKNLNVCGCFNADVENPKNSPARLTFKINNRQIHPVSLSARSAVFQIPAGTKPGLQKFYINSPDKPNSFTGKFSVIDLLGTIDRNRIWTGEGTSMRLRITGTKDKIPLEITNQTPDIIEVEGGIKQKIETSGGRSNSLSRRVIGKQRGDFIIDYKIDLPLCSK